MNPLKYFFLALAIVVCGGSAQAAQVDLATFYDAPEGNFKELDITGASNIGTGNNSTVTFGVGGGATTFGGPWSGSPRPFTVRAAGGGTPQGLLLNNGRYGIRIGSMAGLTYGTISGVQPGGAETILYLNAAPGGGGVVNIGDSSLAQNGYALQVTGQNNATLGVTQGGRTGQVKINYAVDGFYDTYAP